MRKITELPSTAMPIKNSKDYINVDGKIYTPLTNYKGMFSGVYAEKAQHVVKGYKYCGIYNQKDGHCHQKRVHRIVAEAFIPNPNNLPIVGHKNNIKTDNRVENLYWTTPNENIQKAVDDGLLINDKGETDSQSKPVVMYDTLTNELLGEYGSIIEATEKTGIAKTTISRQAKYHRPVRKPFYFRYRDDKTAVSNQLVGQFEYDTDRLIKTYINISSAAKETGVNEKTISQQCNTWKPKHKFSNVYFKFINSKCEQTIENQESE